MIVYVLVRVTPTNQTPGPMAQYPGCPVHASLTNNYGGPQSLPDFCQFVITDADSLEQVRDAYIIRWRKQIDWEFTNHDYATDTHTLEVFVKPEYVSASGLNRLTRDEVENFLNNWGATVNGISLGRVNFTAIVRNAIQSNGFWGRDVSAVVFTETAYSSATGVHTTNIDFAALSGVTKDQIAGRIVNNGGTVTNVHPVKPEMTFEIGRDAVFGEFKEFVKLAIDGVYAIRRWTVLQPAIDAAIAAGGSLEVTKAQIISYMHNRLSD